MDDRYREQAVVLEAKADLEGWDQPPLLYFLSAHAQPQAVRINKLWDVAPPGDVIDTMAEAIAKGIMPPAIPADVTGLALVVEAWVFVALDPEDAKEALAATRKRELHAYPGRKEARCVYVQMAGEADLYMRQRGSDPIWMFGGGTSDGMIPDAMKRLLHALTTYNRRHA